MSIALPLRVKRLESRLAALEKVVKDHQNIKPEIPEDVTAKTEPLRRAPRVNPVSHGENHG